MTGRRHARERNPRAALGSEKMLRALQDAVKLVGGSRAVCGE